MNILNYETPGSERAQVPGITSNIPVIINEDYCMLVRITSSAASGGGITPENVYTQGGPCIVRGEKIWDMGTTKKQFYFLLLRAGRSDYPTPEEITYGQVIPIYRVGEYEGVGTGGFELHTKNDSNISWVAFVNTPCMYLIRALSTEIGVPIAWRNGQWVEIGTRKAISTLGQDFYGTAIVAEELYLGYDAGTYYALEIRGYGEKAKTFTTQVTQLKIDIDVDASGKILDLRATELT